MTSTAPLPVSADSAAPPVPSLSLVPAPRLAVVPAAAPTGSSAPERPAAPASDPSAPAANRPRFRRLVVFTGQLS